MLIYSSNMLQSVRKIEYSETHTMLIVRTEDVKETFSNDSLVCDNIAYICDDVVTPDGGDYLGLVVRDSPFVAHILK